MFTDPFHCAFRDRKLQPNYCLSLVTLTGLQTCLLPAEPFVWFQCTRERLCINQVRSLLSVLGMLLGYSFEPRPNSCALASAGMVMTNGLSINGCLWQGKTRLTSPDVWAVATSKAWRDSGRDTFSPPPPRRQKEALLAGWVTDANSSPTVCKESRVG